MNVAELLAIPASMYPQHEIVHFEGQDLTYEALVARVSRTAGALRSLGVGPGDRIAVMETNTLGVVELLYAATSLRAIFTPLSYRARADELAHLLATASPRVVLVGDRYVDLVASVGAHRDEPFRIVTLEGTREGLLHLPRLVAEAGPVSAEDVDETEPAVMMFTSGTTAAAKAVMLAHGGLTRFVFTTTEPADGSDRGAVLVAAPLYHVAGLTAILAATFAGRRIVLMRQFDAASWLRLVAEQRVTHAFLVPTMLKRILDDPEFATADLSSLRLISYGAAPMPLGVIRRALDAFPPAVQFINAFGQTETTSTVTMLGPDDHRLDGPPDEVEKKVRRLASIGRPLPDVEVRIVDEQGHPLPAGQVGEIAIRTERMMRGYHGDRDATDATIRDGWLRTRDLGWIDEDGYVFLAGRKSDMIIRGGENIAPEEVEVAIASHPGVDEVAVFGLRDDEWGERVAAVVVPRPGAELTAEAVVEYARARLASFKKPEFVFFADELPRNPLGKVLRRELRARYERAMGMGERRGE